MCKDDGARPRICNTGAVNTYRSDLRALVDWVAGTLSTQNINVVISEVLGLNISQFVQMDKGLMGYKQQLRCGHIIVLYDGTESMGIHFEISGQGCREYELLHDRSWYDLFERVLKHGHLTRLDVALDDFKGYFKIDYLARLIKEGRCKSKFKTATKIEKMLIEDGSSKGQTLYYGSPQSRLKIRFYDKIQERLNAGKELEEGVVVWNRTEIEARDERANLLALTLSEYKNEGEVVAGVLKNYISFLKRTSDPNKSRWPVARFWEDFLGDVEKIRLTEVAPDRTVDSIYYWVDKQVRKSIALLYVAFGSDIRWLERIIESGMRDLSEKEIKIIEQYWKMIEIKKEDSDGTEPKNI